MITSRRSFFLGASAFLAAPSIVRVASLMPVSVFRDAPCLEYPVPLTGAGMYCGAFEPKFVVPEGSLYLCTAALGRCISITAPLDGRASRIHVM